MECKLVEVRGLSTAIAALKVSKRHYNLEDHLELIDTERIVTDARGFIQSFPDDEAKQKLRTHFLSNLDKVAKWGAGVDIDDYLDAGHDTLLRYIDLTFVTVGLHRGAQDDLDAHAKRFDSRIVRSSTRGTANFYNNELSEWYQGKVKTVHDALRDNNITIPSHYTDANGESWDYRNCGYVNSKFSDTENINDYSRGCYPLGIPSDAIWKINLYDLRHVYKRRNKYTKASPELKLAMETLADQVETAIPCNLGKLVRYDYAYDLETGTDRLVHIMDIKKVSVKRTNNDSAK